MNILKKIKSIAQSNSNEYIEEAQKSGQKIIGLFCSYVPEEIIHAAGYFPYRMRAVGSTDTAQGDIYYSSINCTFVRHTFSKAMNGQFDFLDGVVFMNGCDHNRRMYDNWRYAEIDPSFLYMFVTPHVINETALKQFVKEVIKLKESIEDFFHITITDESIQNSIELYNKKRSLLSDIYNMRKSKDVPVKGSEILALLLTISAIPVEAAIDIMQEFIEFIKDRVVSSKDDLRIFLSSGCIEELEHIELIEDSGSIVVADNFCLGTKQFNLNIDESKELIVSIAHRYLYHLSCPRMMNDFNRRLEYLHETIDDYSVDAFIAEKLKFCDLWGGEMYLYKEESKKFNYSYLALERELYGGSEGQLRTRLQAFFEQVRNKKLVAK